MKRLSKGILIAIMSLSLLIPVALTVNADVADPYVYVNTTSTNTTTTIATGCAVVLNDCGYPIYDAVIYAEDITIYVGEEFDIMNDVEAYDDDGYGEDLIDQVTVYGEFNTAVPDDYYITYEVTGANWYTVSVEIVLSVVDPDEFDEDQYVDYEYVEDGYNSCFED